MLPEFAEIVETQQFVIVVFLVYFICEIFKHNNILGIINIAFKNTKLSNIVTILTTGFLPIPGRIIMCTSLIDTTNGKIDKNIAAAAYVGTHHFYLWSPIEKSVLVILSGLSISYVEFLHVISVPLFVYAAYMIWMLRNIDTVNTTHKYVYRFKDLLSIVLLLIVLIGMSLATGYIICSLLLSVYILYLCVMYNDIITCIKRVKYSTLLLVSLVLLVSDYLKTLYNILEFNTTHIITSLVLSFLGSYMLGSSSKFSGICLLMVSVFGVEYLCLFYTVDFCGYMLSPMHKCRVITQCCSDLQTRELYYKLWRLLLCMILSAGLYTWYTV